MLPGQSALLQKLALEEAKRILSFPILDLFLSSIEIIVTLGLAFVSVGDAVNQDWALTRYAHFKPLSELQRK
jgi:hypothetical protein